MYKNTQKHAMYSVVLLTGTQPARETNMAMGCVCSLSVCGFQLSYLVEDCLKL
jgi:hypothetical protein